jgi:hypothetical protein
MTLRAAASLLAAVLAAGAQTNPAPHLEKRGRVTQLIVDGKPFLALAGELGNSTATSLENMRPIWPKLTGMHLNTVLPAVSWAMIEPEEGKFDFTLVDGLIQEARRNHLRLVPLWFGSWKNTYSNYLPDWVKRDFERFPRTQLAGGRGQERLTPFSDHNRDADAKAFAAFLRHLGEVDRDQHTVIMVQVENEVGSIPEARDHSPAANQAFERAVPRELLDYLAKNRETLAPELRQIWQSAGFRGSGKWEEVFGSGPETDDLFMAWHYALYIGKVVEAGKAAYRLPMFVNAALIRPSYAPGQYNSGGPLPHSLDIWRAGAPSIDLFTPDIYFNLKEWSAKFARSGNPLFIPEARGGAYGAASAFYSIGHHAAIGFSPFDIENDPGSDLGASYEALGQLAPLILEYQPKGAVDAVMLEELTPSQRIRLGDYTLDISPSASRPSLSLPGSPQPQAPPVPFGIFIAVAPDEYVMAGSNLGLTFTPNTPGPPIVGLGTVQEGQYINGTWVVRRQLAGDETGQGTRLSLRSGMAPTVLRVKLYRYR